jgi:hypothetical protein
MSSARRFDTLAKLMQNHAHTTQRSHFMKHSRSVAIPVFIVLSVAALALAQEQTPPPSPGFDSLKILVGDWEGKTDSGAATHVSYKLASGGSALIETLQTDDEPEMVTVYNADGPRLAMTHFCSANNQPQMRSATITEPTRDFAFRMVSVMNLASPTAGHMHALAIHIEDKDHFTQKWTWKENTKDKVETYRFTRKK